LIAGFGFGYLAARYLAQNRATTEKARASAKPAPGDSGEATDSRATSPGVPDWHKVTRIIHADTIEAEGLGPIRLIGVNLPGSQSLEGNTLLASEAMKLATETLLGKEIRIELEPAITGGGKDEAGNTFAYVYTRDGALFNEEMIRRGDAFAKVDQPSKFLDRFRAAEREAMEKSAGVWSPADKPGKGALLGSASDKGSRRPTGRLPDPIPSSIPPSTLDPRTPGSVVTEPMIFVSSADRMYHKQGCEYLGKKGRPMMLSEAKAAGYVACGRCFASTVMKAP
jgi:endonuclease YncB( thermonuclease family)